MRLSGRGNGTSLGIIITINLVSFLDGLIVPSSNLRNKVETNWCSGSQLNI